MSDDGRCTANYLAWRCEGRAGHYGYHHFGGASWPKDPAPSVPVGPTREDTKA